MNRTDSLKPGNKRKRGNNVIEFTLLVPWYIFLFVGAFDYGFFSYGLIATQNAARVAAMYCAGSASAAADAATACGYALDQLRNMPNVGAALSTCAAAPLTVSASLITGPDGVAASAASVTVTYITPQLIPIPGLFPGQLTIVRNVQMKLRS